MQNKEVITQLEPKYTVHHNKKIAAALAASLALSGCAPMIKMASPSWTECETQIASRVVSDPNNGHWELIPETGNGECYSRTIRPGFNNYPIPMGKFGYRP